MDGHFRAFTFVDRITAVEKGRTIRGHYTIPAGLPDFPPSLIAEATGQLAAWSAMAFVDFASRPVAGLAGRVSVQGEARPGQTLELAVTLDEVSEDAISYGGSASVNGRPLLELEHCVGPMVPLVDFDDPAALRARFELLRGAGAKPGGFQGLGPLSLELGAGEPGRITRAGFTVPVEAPWFCDHFPRKPVFPGSLLLHVNLELVAALAAELPPSRWCLREVSDVKLRAFMPPGERLHLEARLMVLAGDTAQLVVETRLGKRLIGGARVTLRAEDNA
jgi:3-hydroxymyristoyl/3-hydroxydecanoyl-(acyl carrier protein) dehydratase